MCILSPYGESLLGVQSIRFVKKLDQYSALPAVSTSQILLPMIDRLLPTFTTHWAFLNVISQSLISFAGMPNSDMVATLPMWSVDSGFKIDEEVKCVDLLIPCLLQYHINNIISKYSILIFENCKYL